MLNMCSSQMSVHKSICTHHNKLHCPTIMMILYSTSIPGALNEKDSVCAMKKKLGVISFLPSFLPSFLTRCESILGDVEEQNDEEESEEKSGLRQRILRGRGALQGGNSIDI